MAGQPNRFIAATALALATACSPSNNATEITQESATPASIPNVPDAAVYRGAAIAAQVCARCHDTSGQLTAAQTFSAPSFISVANRPDMSAAKLELWLTSLHPSMPNYIFNETTVKDLAAFVMSLRQGS